MSFFKSFILPTSLLAGTIVGAGIFSLPYVFKMSGVGLGIIFLILFTFIYCVIHLMYADLIIKNGDKHRFAGLAKIYFGNFGYWTSILMTIIEMFFVLTIYLILSFSFLSLVFPSVPQIFQVIIFWWVGSVIIFSGIKKISLFEFLSIVGIIGAVALIVFWGGLAFFNKPLELVSSSPIFWLMPFGAILFSLNGRPAVPSVISYFKDNAIDPIKSKKSIIWGTIIPAIIYLAFIFGVLGISKSITPDSVSGIVASISSQFSISVLAILGILALVSSYFSIGLDVFKSLEFDLKFSKFFSMFLAILAPIFIYFLDIGGFIKLVEIAGGFFIGFEGIFIVAMWSKMRSGELSVGHLRRTLILNFSPILKNALYFVFGLSILYVVVSTLFNF